MPKALFAIQNSPTYDYGRLLNDVHRKVAGLDAIIILDDTSATAQPPTAHIDGYLRYEEMLLQGQGRERLVAELSSHVKCVDVLNLQFTSGSTGRPKAAALTHYGMINSARYIAFQMGISPKDRIAVPVPLFHAFGLIIGKSGLELVAKSHLLILD